MKLFRTLNAATMVAVAASAPAPLEPLTPRELRRAKIVRVLSSPGALTLTLGLALAACGINPAHATDTGTVETSTLDSGAFAGVVSGTGTYINNIIKNYGVPAILVGMAVSGWAFVRHIAKSAFH